MNSENKAPNGSGKIVNDFSPYCEGDIEPTLNKKIHTLVDSDVDYIVYLDDEFCVEWSMTDKYDASAPQGFGEIADQIGHLEVSSMGVFWGEQKERFGRLLAEAMARIIGDKDIQEARKSLSKAKSYLQARGLENARSWYARVAIQIIVVEILVGALLWASKSSVVGLIGRNGFDTACGSIIGAIGAFLFVLRRLKNIQLDPSAGRQIHVLESAIRIITGNISGFFMALAFKADFLLGLIRQTQQPFAVLIVLCFVAGYSERWIPSLIKQVEDSAQNDKEE